MLFIKNGAERMSETSREMRPLTESADAPGKPGRLLHFCYGSNMNPEQLRFRGVRPFSCIPARLRDYRLSFHGHLDAWDGAVATVVPALGHEVWGVVYELSFSAGDCLDGWQGVRLDGAGPYFHCPAMVYDARNAAYSVLLYKKDVLGESTLPSREYLDYIMAGALERGLPSEYIEALGRLDSKRAGYTVPLRGQGEARSLGAGSCAECAG